MEHRDKFARPPVWAPFDRARLEEHRKSQVQLEGIHRSRCFLPGQRRELHIHLGALLELDRRPLQTVSRIAIRIPSHRWWNTLARGLADTLARIVSHTLSRTSRC